MTRKLLNTVSINYPCVIGMSDKRYSTVSIPRATFLMLTRVVGHFGFRSTAEVVMHCIRKQSHEITMWVDQIEKADILHDMHTRETSKDSA